MTLIVCVDERMGMGFNRRRQSRDRAVYADIVALADGQELTLDPRSAALFEGLCVRLRPGALDGELIFCELTPPSALPCPDRVVLYCWNRHYPADVYFDLDLVGWKLMEETEFPGTSHERITKRSYIHGES